MGKTQEIRKITFTGVMLALAIVLSSFCQIKLFSDIRLDLSYLIIPLICYLYGGLVGGFFAAGVALINSLFFSSYGVSISWISANFIIGTLTGLVMSLFKSKDFKNWKALIAHVAAIVLSSAIGLLFVKTIIECNLYEIPFEIKIVKNAVAFGSDTILMLVGYFVLTPIYNRLVKKDNKTTTNEQA